MGALKGAPGGDLLLPGSASLASALIPQGLIDEFRILVNTLWLGQATPLFRDLPGRRNLTLRDTRFFSNGKVLLRYRNLP